jgi:hypothetical protein
MRANRIGVSSGLPDLVIARHAPIAIHPSSHRPIRIVPSQETITIRPACPLQIRPSSHEFGAVRPQTLISIRPTQAFAAAVRPAPRVKVDPPQRGAWDERGWTRRTEGRNEIYAGNYQAGQRTFAGRIQIEERSRRITAFIHNPPREIKRHRKGPCFQQYGIGTGWFVLHWRRPAQNVDDAILYMERILDESITR